MQCRFAYLHALRVAGKGMMFSMCFACPYVASYSPCSPFPTHAAGPFSVTTTFSAVRNVICDVQLLHAPQQAIGSQEAALVFGRLGKFSGQRALQAD